MSDPAQAPPHLIPAPAGVSAERMQALLDYSWDILSLLDSEGRLIYNSPAAQRLHGFTPAEMEGRSTFEFFHPDDAPSVGETFLRCLAQPGLPHRVEYRYARKDGTWIWMEAVAVNLLDNPTVRAIVVNSRDISERVQGQLALQESQRFADLILDALPANLVVLDARAKILKVNQAWRNFALAAGVAPDFAWEGLDYLEVCERAAGLGSEQARAMADGIRGMLENGSIHFVLEYPCHGPQQARWFQALITRFEGPGGIRLVVSHFDITHLREAEEQRIQLERLLHRSQKMESLGSLAGGVAHDMNNVLGSILGMASMHQELESPHSPAHQAFAIITKACHRGGGLARRLLDFARQDLSEVREVDLNILVQEEVQLLEHTTLGQVRLVTDLAPELRPIQGDSAALVHAIMNLCLNAVDAMPGGGDLVLRTRNVAPGRVELRVEDSGTGMPKEIQEKVLEPFFTTKPMGKGTGLGLSIVYGTVKAHQGSMDIESEPGQGTTVILQFPAAEVPCTGDAVVSTAPATAASPALDILLVDDDELIRNALGPVIRCLGHRVTVATTGEEALERLKAGVVPQVVILDVNMPGLGGQGTLPQLRRQHPDLPVLLATGRVDQTALELSRAFPDVTLIPKPFSMGELKARLDALAMQLARPRL